MRIRTLQLFAATMFCMIALPVVAAEEAVADHPPPTLSLVTLDLAHVQKTRPARVQDIIAGLRELHPDVIVLQHAAEDEALPNQARTLAEALDYRFAFTTPDAPGTPTRSGSAILTRHRVLAQDWQALQSSAGPEHIAHLRLAIGTRAVDVYALQLRDAADDARQLADALDFIRASNDGAPVLLATDLGLSAGATASPALLGEFVDALETTTPNNDGRAARHSRRSGRVLFQRDAFAMIESREVLGSSTQDDGSLAGTQGMLTRVRLLPSRGAHSAQPWRDPGLTPDARADALISQMTQDEKFRMLRAEFGMASDKFANKPEGAIGSAGYVPANTRLGIPALQETDAGLGVASAGLSGDGATALPANLAIAASWDPAIAHAGGAMIGRQAWRKGFNVLLAGSVNLQRDPRNGRNFEYLGEDPLLAGVLAGQEIRGVQDQHVVSTLKHFAMNDYETSRNTHSAELDARAMHESDLLAFEIAHETGQPGSVMSAYNRVNGVYAGEHDWLLNQVLKRDWGFSGWVMSDWGGAHSAGPAANAGLDQQSAGEVFDKAVHFDKPLRQAVARGEVPQARIDDMARRVLRSMLAHGTFEHPPQPGGIDYDADGAVAQRAAEAGTVLLRNRDDILPLATDSKRIVVVGGHADAGVLSGGGSSMVKPPGGNAVKGTQPDGWPGPPTYQPSAPLQAIRARVPNAHVDYLDGLDVAAAAEQARNADVVVVFANQWAAESFDHPTMQLPDGQDALIAALAAANPRTVVVLQTNGPVTMPWLDDVAGLLQAWYPGARGGEAIARLLFGEVTPRGRLPVSWPHSESQLPRPWIEGAGYQSKAPPMETVNYRIEGANVGYKWFAAKGTQPLFPFGFGLSYTSFAHAGLALQRDDQRLRVYVDATNTGERDGVDVVQAYLHLPADAGTPLRLIGWQTVALKAGETRRVAIEADPRTLAEFDVDANGWRIRAGHYRMSVGASATDTSVSTTLELPDLEVTPDARVAMPE